MKRPVGYFHHWNGFCFFLSTHLLCTIPCFSSQKKLESMATEASLTDQAAHKEVEEMKVDDKNDVNEDIVFQPKVLERKEKEEEELKVEDPTTVEASVTEKTKISDDSIDTLVEDMKKEEENKESTGGASNKEPNYEATEQKENFDDLSDALVEGVKVEEENKVEAAEKEPESAAVEQKEISVDSSDVVVEDVKKEEKNREPESVATEKEPESEPVEPKESLDDSSDAVVEVVKKEEENKEPEGVADEKKPDSEAAVVEDVKEEENKEPEGMATEKERDSEAAVETTEYPAVSLIHESAAESVKDIDVSEGVTTEKERDSEATVETTENSAVPLIQESAAESAKDIEVSEDVANEKEPDSEAAVETTENSAVSLIQESASESAKDIEISDAEMKTSDDLPSALEIEDKEVETPGIPAPEEQGLAILEAAEATIGEKISPEAVASSEPSKEEISSDEISGLVAAAADISDATSVHKDQVNEETDIGAVVLGAHLPTSDDSNLEDSIKEPVKEESASGEAEVLKILTSGQDKEEKVTLEEEPIVSDALNAETATEVAEKSEKSESLDETSKDVEAPLVSEVASEGVKGATEDDKTTLVETSRGLDMDSTVKEAESESNAAEAIETIIDKSVNKDSEQKKDENEGEKTEDAKDDDQTKTVGEGQEAEVPVKSSQRQSNSIMSKVKHSIVKVKKAIIGKSSSSKNMSPEIKDDTKAK